MAVKIPRFLAWIAAHSPTEFTICSILSNGVLNEGHAQKKAKKTTKKWLDGLEIIFLY
jgi:hypothetical protein